MALCDSRSSFLAVALETVRVMASAAWLFWAPRHTSLVGQWQARDPSLQLAGQLSLAALGLLWLPVVTGGIAAAKATQDSKSPARKLSEKSH